MIVEIIVAIGTAGASLAGAIYGGKNSLNGFKARVDTRFDGLDSRLDRSDEKLDTLLKSDTRQEMRLDAHARKIKELEVPPAEEAVTSDT